MSDVRDFPIAVIASLSSSLLLCKFGDMHEAAEFLMGHPIWTHHFADKNLWIEMNKTIASQYPGLPSEDEVEHVNESNWQEFVAQLETQFGKTVKIRKGSGLTAMLPTDGIPRALAIIKVSI